MITFVPLALIIVHKLPKELGNYWLLKIVAMQTIAANLMGLKFTASIALTDPLNLPAPGRRQLLYIVLRLSRNLCFW